ncbi:Filamin/ABP280 repeat protein [Oesophagostomum dentatum]|uniref:Filamin/ABP280 repeat protein n=1 Tax=Oesophagostomum dentatum TaxID=61180 RepID=A0A0B1T968_OESDE|nr:Filamin/ABP280 repeat protein [Oesophagostomum dentatum]
MVQLPIGGGVEIGHSCGEVRALCRSRISWEIIQQFEFEKKVMYPRDNFFIWGRGINDDGIRINDTVPVYVDNRDPASEHDNDVKVKVVADSGLELPVRRSKEGLRSTFVYTPTTTGKHLVFVTNNGEPIGQTPYKVNISPPTSSRVRAFGPGLEGGVAEQQSVFSVETNEDADRLGRRHVESDNIVAKTANIYQMPKESGVYKVNVLAGGEHITESPFVLMVDPSKPGFQPSAALLTGLEPEMRFVPGEPVPFQIDTRNTGVVDEAPRVEVLDKDLALLPISGSQINPGLYGYSFTPKRSGKYHICASLNGVAIPGSPFPVALADRTGKAVAIDVLDNNDGSFTVKYTAPRPGAYQLNVVFAGAQVPPIEINVEPQVDTSGIRVTGLENAIVTVNCEQEVHVFTPDGDNTRIVITSPSGSIVEAVIESTETGFRVCFTPSEIGDYSISVTYRDLPVGSPYLLHSVPEGNTAEAEYVVSRSGPPRADLVTVTGPGLGPVIAQRSTHVFIDTTSAGFGDIDLFVDGPTRTPIHCVDNHDGTLTMYYVPKTPGVYYLRVMFDSNHISGSPFQVLAVPALVASSLSADGEKTESSFNSLSSGSSTPKTTPCV